MRYTNRTWGDLVNRGGAGGQQMAPGMHLVAQLRGGRKWIFFGWYEELYCRGCRIYFTVSGREIEKVGRLVHKIQKEHSFHMGWTAVFRQLAEFKWAAKDNKMKFKADLTRSVYGDRDEAYGTVR